MIGGFWDADYGYEFNWMPANEQFDPITTLNVVITMGLSALSWRIPSWNPEH